MIRARAVPGDGGRRSLRLLLCLCFVGAGCAPTPASVDAPRPGIRFDPDTLRPGTRVGELTVDSIRPRDPAAGRDAGRAYFRGELTLSGTTMRHPDADLGESSVCFETDPSSAARMPRWKGDERRPWFCFENGPEAERRLARPGELVKATIVIDRFTIHVGASDEVNRARLVRVLARAPAPR